MPSEPRAENTGVEHQRAGKGDEERARSASLRDVVEVAAALDLRPDEIEARGRYVAKVSPDVVNRLADRPNGRYVHVTSMTPMPGWEDPSITAIALADALQAPDKRAACCLQQPSLGAVLANGGIGAGGGKCQVVPRDRLALHLTGDLHAVASAHALLSALADAALVGAGPDGLDTRRVKWRRCQEMKDPALSQVVVGLGGGGVPRESGFDSVSASEVMAILTLSSSLDDLRQRLERIVMGYSHHDLPVFAKAVKASGAMAALLADAIRPNLMQTIAGTPVFVHGSTAVDLSHGGASVLADKIALKCRDVVVTTSEGGAELGLEKFCDIKCRASGLTPDAVVLIASVRGVKYQSGRYDDPGGARLDEPSLQAVKEGAANLAKHLENIRYFGLPCVVVISRDEKDTDEEIEALRSVASVSGADAVVVGSYRDQGGEGATDLAEAVMSVGSVESVDSGGSPSFSHLYEADWPIGKKIETIAKTLYNAGRVRYSSRAMAAIDRYTRLGWQDLAVCMCKTIYSLSHSPDLLGRPYDFVLPVEDVSVAAGAGMLIVRLGPTAAVTPLGRQVRAARMGLSDSGDITGLFD